MENPNANPHRGARAPRHTFAGLSPEQKAKFYQDISFWLTGSDETPFVVVVKPPTAPAGEVQAIDHIWRPRPDWGTYFPPSSLPPSSFRQSALFRFGTRTDAQLHR